MTNDTPAPTLSIIRSPKSTEPKETPQPIIDKATAIMAKNIEFACEGASYRTFERAIQTVEKYARRDNQIGTTWNLCPSFKRFWDTRIDQACIEIIDWYVNMEVLTTLTNRGNYTGYDVEQLESNMKSAKDKLNHRFGDNPYFRNSFLQRAKGSSILTKLTKEAL